MIRCCSGLTISAGLLLAAVAVPPVVAQPVLQAPIQYVACPAHDLRREVVTPLSDGWWQTPGENSLQSVRVEVIADKKTLVCDYGYAGQVMRLPPEGATCAPARGGFECRATNVRRTLRPYR